MTPTEKAKELVDKFQKQIFFAVTDERLDIEEAKGCAIIAVDEILKYQPFDLYTLEITDRVHEHWESVKQEIEKL